MHKSGPPLNLGSGVGSPKASFTASAAGSSDAIVVVVSSSSSAETKNYFSFYRRITLWPYIPDLFLMGLASVSVEIKLNRTSETQRCFMVWVPRDN